MGTRGPGTERPPRQPVEVQFSQPPPEEEKEDVSTVNEAVRQYGGKSDSELMSELVNYRKQGVIDDEKLAEVAARLMPLLNEQQRKRLESVLGTLRST